jgi:hypothetical protein
MTPGTPCPACGVRCGDLSSVNLRDGKSFSYCGECGTEKHAVEGAPSESGRWEEAARLVERGSPFDPDPLADLFRVIARDIRALSRVTKEEGR